MTALRIATAAVVIGTALLAPAPVVAHHSAAMFDDTKVVELTGTVKELQWANPHIWLQVIVDDKGKKTEWSLEGGSPNSLSRDRKSTRLNSSHSQISYAVFCLKKKNK